jgi:hypothetical protein
MTAAAQPPPADADASSEGDIEDIISSSVEAATAASGRKGSANAERCQTVALQPSRRARNGGAEDEQEQAAAAAGALGAASQLLLLWGDAAAVGAVQQQQRMQSVGRRAESTTDGTAELTWPGFTRLPCWRCLAQTLSPEPKAFG